VSSALAVQRKLLARGFLERGHGVRLYGSILLFRLVCEDYADPLLDPRCGLQTERNGRFAFNIVHRRLFIDQPNPFVDRLKSGQAAGPAARVPLFLDRRWSDIEHSLRWAG